MCGHLVGWKRSVLYNKLVDSDSDFLFFFAEPNIHFHLTLHLSEKNNIN